MVIYWRLQFWADLLGAVLITVLLIEGKIPFAHANPTPSQIVHSCQIWVAPIMTLLGLTCATTAFLFTAIDRSDFVLLRTLGVEYQLWIIFSEIIFWLALAAISAASISIVRISEFPQWLEGYAVFLFVMVSICLFKFAWVMRHVIGVRMRRSKSAASKVNTTPAATPAIPPPAPHAPAHRPDSPSPSSP